MTGHDTQLVLPNQAGFWRIRRRPCRSRNPCRFSRRSPCLLPNTCRPLERSAPSGLETCIVRWMGTTSLAASQTEKVLSVKLIRNKQTGQLEGYGFIEFSNRTAAEKILQSYTDQHMPNTKQPFRLNWASISAGERRGDEGTDYTIFVGDLAADVTDYVLQETFRPHYSSFKGGKVVTDRATGHSKGYGFVRFGDANEHALALTEMNGKYCSSRPLRIGAATTKKNMGTQQYSTKGCPEASF